MIKYMQRKNFILASLLIIFLMLLVLRLDRLLVKTDHGISIGEPVEKIVIPPKYHGHPNMNHLRTWALQKGNNEVNQDKIGELNPDAVMSTAFKSCDVDRSDKISLAEASLCINKQVNKHLNDALKSNIFIFMAVDINPMNGAISWQEHVAYFMQNRGYNQSVIDAATDKMAGLSRIDKVELMRLKASWSETAGNTDQDLSLDQFMSFRHPESSHANIISKVEENLGVLDINGDGKISQSEMDEMGETKPPFPLVDTNKDGFMDRREMLKYEEPKHIHHAEEEAQRLFDIADKDEDGFLSRSEIQSQFEMFSSSKMVDAAKSFHNEM